MPPGAGSRAKLGDRLHWLEQIGRTLCILALANAISDRMDARWRLAVMVWRTLAPGKSSACGSGNFAWGLGGPDPSSPRDSSPKAGVAMLIPGGRILGPGVRTFLHWRERLEVSSMRGCHPGNLRIDHRTGDVVSRS